MGKKKNKKKTTSVGVPLDPKVLSDIGAIRRPLSHPDEMCADGAYSYRIWLTYGNREKNNRDVGWLKVRQNNMDDQTASFSAERMILNGSDRDRPLLFTRHTAEIICANDSLLSLRSFKGNVTFTTVPDTPTGALKGFSVTGQNVEGDLRLHNGAAVTAPCAADWLLPAAIERVHSGEITGQQFTMLEALTAVKKQQMLYADEPYEGEWFGKKVYLKRLLHTGEGIMPTIYWIDKDCGVALITSGYLALVRDINAESIYDELKAEAING